MDNEYANVCRVYEESFALGIGFKHLPTTVRVQCYIFPLVYSGFHRFSQATKDHRQKLGQDRKISKYRSIVWVSILFWCLIKNLKNKNMTCKKARNIQNILHIMIFFLIVFCKNFIILHEHLLVINKQSSLTVLLAI